MLGWQPPKPPELGGRLRPPNPLQVGLTVSVEERFALQGWKYSEATVKFGHANISAPCPLTPTTYDLPPKAASCSATRRFT